MSSVHSDDEAPVESGDETSSQGGKLIVPDQGQLKDKSKKKRNTRANSPQPPFDLAAREHSQLERFSQMSFLLKDALTSLQEITLMEAETTLEDSKELFRLFQADHVYLICNCPPAQLTRPYYKEHVASLMATEYHKLKRRLMGRITELRPPRDSSTTSKETTQQQRPRLPELTIPKFEGEYLKWPDFKALFLSVIGKRSDLADVERFYYLKGAVTGPPADLISHLPPEDSSFVGAMKLLIGRYENKRLIISSHVDRLLNLTPMTKRSSKSLLKLVDIANESAQALHSQSKSTHDCTCCYILVQHMIRLLDKDTRELWEQHIGHSEEFPSLTTLTKFLTTRARALESIEKPVTTSTYSSKVAAHQASQPSSSTQSRKSTQAEPLYACDMCSGSHFIVSCSKFRDLSVSKRMAVVKDRALCVSCLGRHNVRKCNSKWVCKICKERHHTMLHGGDISTLYNQRATQPSSSLPPRPAGASTSSEASSAAGPSTGSSTH